MRSEEATRALKEKDIAHLIHPNTVLGEHEVTGPLILTRGEGVTVYDADGREYVDGLAGLWNCSLGHGRRDVIAAITEQMERLAFATTFSGISNDTTIIVYGDGNNRSATWAFWLLKYYRHRDVRLLDGGRKRWLAAGLPLSADSPRRTRASYTIGKPLPSLRARRDYILRRLQKPGFLPLDVRTRDEYAGIDHPDHPQTGIQRLGHMPGAVNLDWEEAAGEDGMFLPPEELARRYCALGVTPDKEVVTYCRLGVRASYSWFVLKHLLDYPRVRNYDGSWTEWGNLVSAPIEK